MKSEQNQLSFSLWRLLRLSSFQIGSAMGDIIVTSIWNRVMISQFGIPAAPVSLLIALRYLLSPLSLWAGHRSDTRPFLGMRRTSYIWLGRGLMVLSLPLLGWSLMRFAAVHDAGSNSDLLGWILAIASSLLYGVGTLISGSPYLALVRDSAPKSRQGLAISTAETVLIIFFAIVGITFSFWMEEFDPVVFWEMVIATMLIGSFFWVFSIWGVEQSVRRQKGITLAEEMAAVGARARESSVFSTMQRIWQDKRTRRFFIFLSLATFSAWAQDAILEPFGAEVFDLPLSRTTRFNSYWQAATVLTLVGGAYLWRKRPPERQRRITSGGLVTMAVGMGLLAATAVFHQVHLVEISLLVFGAGFGIYTFGGLSLMAVMSSDKEAGAYLGLWTISVVVFKGLGTFAGGALRDFFLLSLELGSGLGYGLIFLMEGVGLATAVFILTQVDVLGFARDMGRVISRTEVQIASAD
ncbi:MAG: BCD family MFS transporter [Ardenticatenaceae bacterium]|nr:BCD family MFS transporter [Ardenticatenaceae bacterium]MCB8949346.1 BCD family MFS transporter [Ardenticatenaceae bacterium]